MVRNAATPRVSNHEALISRAYSAATSCGVARSVKSGTIAAALER
jgi:hypothetical protein